MRIVEPSTEDAAAVAAGVQSQTAEPMPLWLAWLVHVVAAFVAACLVGLAVFVAQEMTISGSLFWEEQSVGDVLALVLINVAVIEAAFVLLAVALLPWGAGRLTPGQRWRHCLRTSWLGTVWVGAILAVWSWTLVVLVATIDRSVFDEPDFFNVNVLAIEAVLLAIWAIRRLIRDAAAEPDSERPELPPQCESCGYDLSFQAMEGRCPECGEPVAHSIDGERRKPFRWSLNPGKSHGASYFEVCLRSWLNPEKLLRRVQTGDGLWPYGAFLLANLTLVVPAFLLGVLAGVAAMLSDMVGNGIRFFYMFFCWAGVFSTACVGAFIALVAAGLGFMAGKSERRNRWPAAVRTACLCSAIFPPWVGMQMFLTTHTMSLLQKMNVSFFMAQSIFFLVFFGSTTLLAVVFTSGVWRRMRYLRYANT